MQQTSYSNLAEVNAHIITALKSNEDSAGIFASISGIRPYYNTGFA